MQFRIEPPPCPDSPLARLDPRWKLAALLLGAVLVAAVRTLVPSALALLGALALAAAARLPWRWYLGRVAAVGLFVALFTLPLPLLLDGGPAWQVGPAAGDRVGKRAATG